MIGIDDYAKWPKLRYAVNDAKAIRDLLIRRHQFKPENIFMLLDREATRENILSLLGDKLANPALVKHDDRVFVFFAGHGATRQAAVGPRAGLHRPGGIRARELPRTGDLDDQLPGHLRSHSGEASAVRHGLLLQRPGAHARRAAGRRTEFPRRRSRAVPRARCSPPAARTSRSPTAGRTDTPCSPGRSCRRWKATQTSTATVSSPPRRSPRTRDPIVSSLSSQTPAFGSLPGSEGGDFVFELRHEGEFLNDQSAELDQEAIQLNTEIAKLRAEITAKNERNRKLKEELAQTQLALQRAQPDPEPVRSSKDTAAARNDRGTALFREKKYAEAAEEFKAAFELDPASALAANNLGFAYYKMGNYVDAAIWFEKALAIDPKRAIAYYNLGDAWLQLNRSADAKKAFEQFLQLQPNAKAAPQAREKLQMLEGKQTSEK